MDGTNMMPILVVGKSAKPRAFQGIKKLPEKHVSNRKAWMRSHISEEEMRNFDCQMKTEGRKVCTIADNCSVHTRVEFQNTEFVFLPSNTASNLQSMDREIIRNLEVFLPANLRGP